MEVRITGLEQVQRAFAEAPKVMGATVLAKALDRAAGVIAAEVEARTPEGPEGLLKECVKTQVAVDASLHGGEAIVGFTSTPSERQGVPMDAVALWVEYGHRILTHATGEETYVDKRGRTRTRKTGKQYSGERSKPNPFMRTALESAGDRAIEVFAETMIDGLSEIGGKNS